MNIRRIKQLGTCLFFGAVVLVFITACSLWGSNKKAEKSLVIKPEDFSIFLFESSEEIYRANVKDPKMWAVLRDQAQRDPEYAFQYNWLYESYSKWDEHRRSQLNQIMNDYLPQPISERIYKKEKQAAGLEEILKFISQDSFFRKNRSTLVDFYSWYGANYALPQYERIRPLLQQKADITNSMVEKEFDPVSFMEKETGIRLREKPGTFEMILNMRMIPTSGFYRDKDSVTPIKWSINPEKIWTVSFHEIGHNFFRTITGKWSFRFLANKLKKDKKLMDRFKEDVPYTWDGWIEENLTEGFARYVNVKKGITRDVGEGIYVFDQEYAQALVNGFNPQTTSLKDFTVKFLKQKYKI